MSGWAWTSWAAIASMFFGTFSKPGGGQAVPAVTASGQAAGGTLGQCPRVQQHPDGGVPEQVKVAGRPQANLGRDAEHLRVHDCEVVARQELIDQQL